MASTANVSFGYRIEQRVIFTLLQARHRSTPTFALRNMSSGFPAV
jgi:hypothetical protein